MTEQQKSEPKNDAQKPLLDAETVELLRQELFEQMKRAGWPQRVGYHKLLAAALLAMGGRIEIQDDLMVIAYSDPLLTGLEVKERGGKGCTVLELYRNGKPWP